MFKLEEISFWISTVAVFKNNPVNQFTTGTTCSGSRQQNIPASV